MFVKAAQFEKLVILGCCRYHNPILCIGTWYLPPGHVMISAANHS